MTEIDDAKQSSLVASNKIDVKFWIQFFVGVIMLFGVFHYDVKTGGTVVSDWIYAIPTVLLFGVPPMRLLDAVVELAKAYLEKGKS